MPATEIFRSRRRSLDDAGPPILSDCSWIVPKRSGFKPTRSDVHCSVLGCLQGSVACTSAFRFRFIIAPFEFMFCFMFASLFAFGFSRVRPRSPASQASLRRYTKKMYFCTQYSLREVIVQPSLPIASILNCYFDALNCSGRGRSRCKPLSRPRCPQFATLLRARSARPRLSLPRGCSLRKRHLEAQRRTRAKPERRLYRCRRRRCHRLGPCRASTRSPPRHRRHSLCQPHSYRPPLREWSRRALDSAPCCEPKPRF